MTARPALPGGAALLLLAATVLGGAGTLTVPAGLPTATPALPAARQPQVAQMATPRPAATMAPPAAPFPDPHAAGAPVPADAAGPAPAPGSPATALTAAKPGAATPDPAASDDAPAGGTPDADTAEALPLPPVSPRLGEGRDYEHCMDMMASDPSGALDFAEAWEATGGGEGAQHCHAMASIELGDPAVGAALLDRLAQNSAAPALTRAAVFGQADQAWMMAGDAPRAYASATLATTLSPDDPDLLIDRSVAAAALGRFPEVVDDLTRALGLDPRRADALVYRAAAQRHLEHLDLAGEDIDRAFALDPDDPEALLERGIIRERTGNLRGAREDWQRAAELAPDSGTGDLAQQNLALLEAGPAR